VTPNLAAGETHAKGAIAPYLIGQQQALAGVIARIRESLDIDTIFTTTATEVRQLLEADRVAVFRFYPDRDWEGEFVSEDVVEPWNSALAAKVYDHCFGEQYAIQYQQGRVQAVADIHDAGLQDCHLEILGKFSVRANLVAPLLQGEQLWGLLCIHQCRGPRQWQASEIDFVKQIAEHLSVALQHAQWLAEARAQAQQQEAITGVIARIRESLDLEDIFQIAAAEVRQLLQADRVAVFRFYPDRDWEGEFVSEDVVEPWDSALAAKVYDHCFGEQFAIHYQQGRVQAVADIYQAGLSDCHVEILGKFKVRANLAVPLLQGEQLWGLLCIHQCRGPRQWLESEIDFVKQIAAHFAVALQQAEYLEQLQAQTLQLANTAARERTLSATVDKIRQSLDLDRIFQTTTDEVRNLLQASRVAIYRFNPDWTGSFLSESVASGWNLLMQEQLALPEICENVNRCSLQDLANPPADTYLQETAGGSFSRSEPYRICNDIYDSGFSDCYIQVLETYQARAYVIVAIYYREQLWGLLAAYQNSAARHWQPDEVELLVGISNQLGVAIQQAEYLKQVQTQSAQLAQAREQQTVAERHRTIAAIANKIRQSLELDNIFNTATTEVRQLLQADRVAIYRFLPDWTGEFVAESMASGWTPLVGVQGVIEDTFLQETQGGRYADNETFAVADIYKVGHADCHVELLEQFEAKAYVVVPIFLGEKLWGLLAAYQNSGPRDWEASEVDLLAQIGIQLGVAIQQADYLKQVQTQSAQLAQAREQQKVAERQRTIAAIADKIRQSLEIDNIFNTATTEVRQLLEADRVAIYRLNPDWTGSFLSESVASGWNLLTIEQLEHPEICENVNRCSMQDLANPPADTYLQETAGGPFSRSELYRVCNDIYGAGFSDCYIQVLETYQARAYVIVAIYHGEKLWGLLAAYQNSGPRHWQADEVDLLVRISSQLGIAIQQAEYLKQVEAQSAQLAKAAEQQKAAERQKSIAAIGEKIRQSLDLDRIFQTATQEVRQLLQASRVAIYHFSPDWSGEFVAESLESGWTPLLGMQVTDTHFQETSGGRYIRNESLAVNDIYQAGHADCHVELLETFEAKAYIIAPILQGKKLWGLLAAYQNSGPRDWQVDEVDLLAQIGTQLGVAIQQAEYLKQVEAQAAQLAKAAERQRALATTVDKIRQSLDIDTIFDTTTQEVRRLLEVERIAIYRFYSDWSGEFVADSIVDDWTPVVKKQSAMDRTVLKEVKGGKYPRNETFVPILQGEKLWGLLVASQTSQPRYWQDEEINLLTQVGVQLGVALQQAELLDQTRQQAKELIHALEDLQQTQAQMIQNEKMASLGQLVAGVAHEINNPVSFIYGNLVHVSEYTEDLLSFVQLYQKHYPDPAAEIQELAEATDLDFIVEDLPNTIASMQMGADRIRQIVLSLRNFSRLDEAEMKPVNIHEGMESTLLILQHRLTGNGNSPEIELVKEYGELPEVPCHAAQLNQVFMNIISNAIDALSESATNNPQIIIRTEVAPDRALIRIADNGPGMPKEVRSRIFDPFFTTKPVGKGTGLGLSISYKIVVEKHRGKLKCTSQPGHGTEFSIEIPIKQ